MEKYFARLSLETIKDSKLSDAEFRLYSLLLVYAFKTGKAWPSVETIAKDLRCSRRSVSRHLQQLEAKGYIAISRSMKDGKRQNVYKIHSDVPILSIRS